MLGRASSQEDEAFVPLPLEAQTVGRSADGPDRRLPDRKEERHESRRSAMTTGADETDPAEGPSDDEVTRLKSELTAARSQLDVRERRHRRIVTMRKIVASVLVAVAAFGLVASVIGVWAARTTLDTNRWVATVTPLDQDPKVRAAVSTLLTEQIFSTLNVQQRIEESLPPKAAFLAAPLTSRVHSYTHQKVNEVLLSQRFRSLWPALNETAHKKVMAIINNDGTVAKRSGETVTLDLLPIVNEVLRLLEKQIPSIFGNTITLPAIQNGQVPAGLKTRIESALGVQLPDNFASITIYRGNELAAAQDAVVLFKRSVALLVFGALLLVALALWVSPTRRRTTLQLGIWIAIAVVVLTALLRAIRKQLVEMVPGGVYRDGAGSAITVVFRTLRERGTQLLWLGILIAAIAYLAGPGRGPVALRRWLRNAFIAAGPLSRRWTARVVSEGPIFARDHLDVLRLGGIAVAAGLVLFVFSSWTALFVIAIVLGAYVFLVTAAAGSAPEPESETEPRTIVLPSPTEADASAQSSSAQVP
jgi:hypothetical protein